MNPGKREHASGAVASLEDATADTWPELAYRELVSRIVSSPTFSRAERLSSLLTYVCDMSLRGREDELNEQRIGQDVFRRSPNYDCSIDGIVRTQASRLRQRLDMYYEQEGLNEAVRVVIPKGGYVPVFTPHSVLEPPAPPVQQTQTEIVKPAEVPVPSVPERHPVNLFPWVLCVLLAAGFAALLVRDHMRAVSEVNKIASHPLWGRLFVPGQPTIEVPGDSGLVISHAFDWQTVPLVEYLGRAERNTNLQTSPDAIRPGDTKGIQFNISHRRYTSMVDLDVAVGLGHLAQAARSSLDVRFARDLRPNDLKHGNLIFVGASEANPWVELFENNMNFVLKNDYSSNTFLVKNRVPQPGEPDHWERRVNDPQRKVYGVLAFVPNLSANGNVLIIEGTSMAGTEAAWDFVSDDSELLPFLKKIQHPDGKIPNFELLLGTQNMSSSAGRTSILAWRTHD